MYTVLINNTINLLIVLLSTYSVAVCGRPSPRPHRDCHHAGLVGEQTPPKQGQLHLWGGPVVSTRLWGGPVVSTCGEGLL